MSDGKHAGPDASFRTSVLQNLGGAVLLVVLVAGLFWAIGLVGRADDDTPVASDVPEANDAPAEDDDVPPDEGADEAADDDVPAAEDEDAPAGDADAPGSDDDSDDEADPDTDGDPDPEPEPEDEPEPEPEPDPDPEPAAIPPGDISVQVLDGYQADGGTAADGVASQLSDAGYRIVAQNPALRYEVTTVLWTSGNEAAGRQVAAEIGAAEVREQPGNLSDSVAVHVVVGADRG